MRKSILMASMLALGSSVLQAGGCDAKVEFTFYGAKDNSYIVAKNTFTSVKVTGDKLEGATAEIDLLSIDTGADLNNGKAKWPAAMAVVRDNNTKNAFFKKMGKDKGKATAKVVKVDGGNAEVEVTMNGVTEKITMALKTEGDTTTASGKLDVAKFDAAAWKSFSTVCKGFHKGASNSVVDLSFSVPASCK